VFVSVHQEFVNSSGNLQENEEKLCHLCKQTIRHNKFEGIDSNYTEVVNAKHGHSILILIACRSLHSVDDLEKMNKTGRLQTIFFNFFAKIGLDFHVKATRLRIENDQLHKVRIAFEGNNSNINF